MDALIVRFTLGVALEASELLKRQRKPATPPLIKGHRSYHFPPSVHYLSWSAALASASLLAYCDRVYVCGVFEEVATVPRGRLWGVAREASAFARSEV